MKSDAGPSRMDVRNGVLALMVLTMGCQSAGNFAPLDHGGSLPLGNDHPRPRTQAKRADTLQRLSPAPEPTPSPLPLPDGGWTILAPDQGPDVLKDCMEGGLVKNVDAFWKPSPEKVAEVDTALGELLVHQVDFERKPVSPLQRGLLSYYRQYVGITARGRSLVYVAAYSAAEMAEMGKRGVQIDWLREPLGEVCDGGTYFFRAAFDVAKSKFVMFSYGGPAWSCCDSRDARAAQICDDRISCDKVPRE